MEEANVENKRSYAWVVIPWLLASFILALPIIATFTLPNLMQCSDFLMTFYLAGRLVIEHRAIDLYPPPDTTVLFTTPFNKFAHEVLPALPPKYTAIYMYSPLTACIFVPYAFLPREYSLAAWQLTSIAILLLCAFVVASVTKKKVSQLFLLSLMCFPIFQTLLIGHLGIQTGLLPLCLAYYFLMKKKPFPAGICLSLLLLKPQFLPIALLIVGALTLAKQFKLLYGFVVGVSLFCALTVVCLTPDVFQRWLLSHKFSDTIFCERAYGYPVYLMTCAPAAVLHMFPVAMRNIVKIPTYSAALLIGLHALYICWKQAKKAGPDYNTIVPFILLVGILVSPLVVPHFLFYDLNAFAFGGMLILGHNWPNMLSRKLKLGLIISYIVLDAYLILFMFVNEALAQPLILMAIVCTMYFMLTSTREYPAVES